MNSKFIVIEGLDGCGKSTQIRLLSEKLEAKGLKYKFIHFPLLNKGVYGKMIAEFLRGEYGALNQVHPKLVALLYANDRKENAHIIRQWLDEGYYVIADRYVFSNIVFQCAKLGDETAKRNLKDWILHFEYVENELPVPAWNFFLDMPFDFIRKSLTQTRSGNDRDYLCGKQDIHEASLQFQENVYAEYKHLVAERDDFIAIDCAVSDGKPKSPDEINRCILDLMEQVFQVEQ